MATRKTKGYFEDLIQVLTVPGTKAKLERIAEREGLSYPETVRAALRSYIAEKSQSDMQEAA